MGPACNQCGKVYQATTSTEYVYVICITLNLLSCSNLWNHVDIHHDLGNNQGSNHEAAVTALV